MTWVLIGDVSSDWSSITIASPYVARDYVEPDYFEDLEWTVTPDDDDVWTLT